MSKKLKELSIYGGTSLSWLKDAEEVEKKDLLLKDLCARLLYGVNGLAYIVGEPCNTNTNIVGIINESIVTNYESPMLEFIDLDSKDITIKPYLRPMSSMTDEEEVLFRCELPAIAKTDAQLVTMRMELFLKGHLDFNHLIEKGLALEAPDGMYNIKEK